MSEIKGFIFDFNGTLFFDSTYHHIAFEKCFEKYGLPVMSRPDMIKNMFGRTNEQIFKTYYKPDATPEEVAEFEELKEQLYISICKQNSESLHLCDGACELFDYLKANGIPYCIATGSPLLNVEFYFEALGIGKYFTLDNIVYSDGSFRGKPYPDIYLLAAERIGLSPDECVVFEDATSGMRAARAAGIGKLIAVWEKGIPCPFTEAVTADAAYHDLSEWRHIVETL